MNRVQSKNKRLSKAQAARQAAKSSAKARSSSSESSGVESASEAIISLGSFSDTESISSSSDTQSSTSGLESISSTGSFYSRCPSSNDYYNKPNNSEEAAEPEEAVKNTEEEKDEAEKAAVITKLMGAYKKLNLLSNQVKDARQKNGKLVGETKKTTDYMMNLMEGSSVTEPLHLFLRRKTKYNMK